MFFRGLGLVLCRKTEHKRPNPTEIIRKHWKNAEKAKVVRRETGEEVLLQQSYGIVAFVRIFGQARHTSRRWWPEPDVSLSWARLYRQACVYLKVSPFTCRSTIALVSSLHFTFSGTRRISSHLVNISKSDQLIRKYISYSVNYAVRQSID